MKTNKNIMGSALMQNPMIDIFVSHQVYPWQVAPQQSLLPFYLTKQS
jgi:hypothetical protein